MCVRVYACGHIHTLWPMTGTRAQLPQKVRKKAECSRSKRALHLWGSLLAKHNAFICQTWFIHAVSRRTDVYLYLGIHCWHAPVSSNTQLTCNTLQHTATHCNKLQHTVTHCNYLYLGIHCCHTPVSSNTQLTCNTLQHTATHCNTLQHTVPRNTLLSYTCF